MDEMNEPRRDEEREWIERLHLPIPIADEVLPLGDLVLYVGNPKRLRFGRRARPWTMIEPAGISGAG
jgi:hypothetical protein